MNLDTEKQITRQLTDNLRGRWGHVLPMVLPELSEAIDRGYRHHVDCPYHGGKNDFRVHRNFDETGGCICTCNTTMTDGYKVIMYARHCDFMTAKNMLIDALGGTLRTDHIPVFTRKKSPEEIAAADAKIKARIERAWDFSKPLSHYRSKPLQNWLKTRCVWPGEDFATIQCNPALQYWESEGKNWVKLGDWPAMLAMVQRPDGRTASLHRTWLEADGSAKAPVPEARKLEASLHDVELGGSAIRIDQYQSPVLSVGEGIETMFAVRLLTEGMQIPVWSAINAVLLEQVVVPDYVKVVVVWADLDVSNTGQSAAEKLVERLRAEGRRAVVLLPPYPVPAGEKSVDWNDVVREVGVNAYREHPVFQAWRRRLREVLFELGEAGMARVAA